MSQENVEILRAAFEAWNAGDMEALLAHFHRSPQLLSGPRVKTPNRGGEVTLADRDDAIDTARTVLAAVPQVEGERHAAIHDECAYRMTKRSSEGDGVRHTFVHMDHVGLELADEPAHADDAHYVELVPEPEWPKRNPSRLGLLLQCRAWTAHDRHVVSLLTQSARGLEHLVHRSGVELIELENLENPHSPSS